MNIELGQLQHGGLILMGDPPFDRPVCRVEYYREQHLMMLVYDTTGGGAGDGDHTDELMPYELSAPAIAKIESSPNVLIVSQTPDRRLQGYDVPLIHIGL